MSLSTCGQNIKGRGKGGQMSGETEERRAEADMSLSAPQGMRAQDCGGGSGAE